CRRSSTISVETAPSPAPSTLGRLERGLLAALLVWAFGVRLWFASGGLDAGRFFDERYVLENVYRFLTAGSLRPAHLFYPELGNLLHTLLLGTADALAR